MEMLRSLIVYPSYYDSHSSLLDEIEERMNERELTHYASCLLEKCMQDDDELQVALDKAFTALTAAQLPATRHFKKVYICVDGGLKTDWLVSDLGLKLIMMNADTHNPIVAKFQIEMLSPKM